MNWGLKSGLLILTFALQTFASASAQEYPTQRVRIIVPYVAGGGVDVLARPVADRLSKLWKQPVIIENRGGAAAMIGSEVVARSAPDGYTLLVTTDGPITTNQFLLKKMPFDPATDLVPVTRIIDLHQMILTSPAVGAKSMKELIAVGKTWPGGMNYGSQGIGSTPHLLFEMLKHKENLPLTNVQYKGLAPALNDLLGGTIQLALAGAAAAGSHLEAGTMVGIATSRPQRLKALPNIPTLAELGYADLHPGPWIGVFAAAGTPQPIIDKIQGDIAAILADPQFREEFIEKPGYAGIGSTTAEFKSFIASETERKKRLLTIVGLIAN